MDAAIEAFGKLVDYEVGEVTAAATFYMAEVYSNFSRSLVESERPAGLSAADLQKYEDALEEEAFPFEEKAIAGPREEPRADARRHLQRVDGEEPRAPRGARSPGATRSPRSAAGSSVRSTATCTASPSGPRSRSTAPQRRPRANRHAAAAIAPTASTSQTALFEHDHYPGVARAHHVLMLDRWCWRAARCRGSWPR